MPILKIKKIDKDIPTPRYATPGAAGIDLCSASKEPITLKGGEFKLIPTGLKFEIETGYEIQIRPRSGIAIRNGVTVLNTPGTIDWDYRGEVKIILINASGEPFAINYGDRIAQMVVNKVEHVTIEVTEEELSGTERAGGGFGSTGV